MTEATETDVERAIRELITNPPEQDEPWHATNVLLHVERKTKVNVSSLQSVFFRMMDDGIITLGPGFVPQLVD